MNVTRRSVARLLFGAPVAAGVAAVAGVQGILGLRTAAAAETVAGQAAAAGESADSGLGKFLARQEDDLTSEERRLVRDEVASLEQALRTVRDYRLGNDVPPAGTFVALKSGR